MRWASRPSLAPLFAKLTHDRSQRLSLASRLSLDANRSRHLGRARLSVSPHATFSNDPGEIGMTSFVEST
jgi:hypothetical protein